MSGTGGRISRTFGWRRVAVAASVALNLFLLAYNGASITHLATTVGSSRPMFTTVLTQAESRLSPDDAARFRAVMTREAPHYIAEAQQLGLYRDGIIRIILSEPFDPAAARSEISAWREAWFGFTKTFGDALVDAMSQISPQGRRELLASIDATRRSGLHPQPVR